LKKENYVNEDFPRITIITPTFNQGQFIEETIQSVIAQQYPNLEYIIIDGGSTDETVSIIKKYQEHISYWVSEKDSGQSEAINKGLKIATGAVINWLNSDDILLPHCLFSVASYFKANPDTDLVYGNILSFNTDTEIQVAAFKPDLFHYCAHICIPQPAAFFTKKMIEHVGPVNESLHFSMDWDLYVRGILAGFKYVQVPDLFCKFRIHNTSKSVSDFNKQFLVDNAFIFFSVIKSIDASFRMIDSLYAALDINIPTSINTYEVNVVVSEEELYLMVFYFLEHRCKTLFFAKDYRGVRQLVKITRKYFPQSVFRSRTMMSRYMISILPRFSIRALLSLRKMIGW
jgi:glycosyltransferase involved in cell wall biosynthesis